MTGKLPDISTFTNFDFYQFVIYYDPNDSDDDGKGHRKLARWLGPSELVGQGLCYYLLKPNGPYIARSTVQPIPSDDYSQNPTIKDEMKDLDFKVKEQIGIFDADLILQTEADNPEEVLFKPPGDGDMPNQDNELDEEDDPDARGFNPLIRAQVILTHKGGDMTSTVVGWKRDANGNLVGQKHKIPVLDSRVYNVEFLDGERQEISNYLLAEHLLSQVDKEGNQYQIFKEIVDHWKDPKRTVDKADQMYNQGNKLYKETDGRMGVRG
jgi:hypothetical protein